MTPTVTSPGRGARTAAGRARRKAARVSSAVAGTTCSIGATGAGPGAVARRGGAARSEDPDAAARCCGRRDSLLAGLNGRVP